MATIIKDPIDFRKKVIELINNNVENIKKSKNIEKSIYNYSIKEATQKKVVKKWDNRYFVIIYKNRLRTIIRNFKNQHFLNSIKNGIIESKTLITCNLLLVTEVVNILNMYFLESVK